MTLLLSRRVGERRSALGVTRATEGSACPADKLGGEVYPLHAEAPGGYYQERRHSSQPIERKTRPSVPPIAIATAVWATKPPNSQTGNAIPRARPSLQCGPTKHARPRYSVAQRGCGEATGATLAVVLAVLGARGTFDRECHDDRRRTAEVLLGILSGGQHHITLWDTQQGPFFSEVVIGHFHQAHHRPQNTETLISQVHTDAGSKSFLGWADRDEIHPGHEQRFWAIGSTLNSFVQVLEKRHFEW